LLAIITTVTNLANGDVCIYILEKATERIGTGSICKLEITEM